MADLIPGMTEIMNHIKELEKSNKMLNNYNEANIKLRQEKEDKIQELEEKITCLESDSYNEVSQAQYEDLQQDYKALEAKLEKLDKELMLEFNEINEEDVEEIKKENEKLKEENQQQQKWFEEINKIIGAEAEDPCVIAVEEYVRKMKIVDNELSKARKYERFLEYRLDQESIDYLIPDDYEERDFEGSSSEEEEEYDTDNEEHSHECETPGCNNNASEDQWTCNTCKKSS